MSYINKQATIDAIYEKANEELADANHHFLAGVHMATAVVRDMPEQLWIPCSERLLDRFGKTLVTFVPGTLWAYVIIANYSDLMGIAKPCFWIGNVGKSDFANITSRVAAWMPLPEPYREEDGEEHDSY